MADIYTTATELAILQAGRTPVWEAQDGDEALTPPSAAGSGVYLEKAVRALMFVALREQPHRRTARLTIPVPDLTCVYTVTINGIDVDYDATAGSAADVDDIVDGIVAALNSDVDVSDIVVASSAAGSTVLLRGVGEADYSVAFTEDSAATLAIVADLCTAEARLWWLPAARVDSDPVERWAWSGETYAVGRRGAIVRVDTAGMERVAIQLSERAGHSGDSALVTYSDPQILIGTCLSELEP